MRVHVVMACHNRRELTVRAMRTAQAAARHADVELGFTVYDDGSTDGTADAVTEVDPRAHVIVGDGSAYWARGMAAAEAAALERARGAAAGARSDGDDEFLLWLNDDVQLDEDAVDRLLQVSRSHDHAVVAGAMRDPATGAVTYGGQARSNRHPLSYRLVQPEDAPREIETFNGNCVLVPLDVAEAVGGIDGAFPHALADIDYGLRCRQAGARVLLAAGTVGTCPRNPPAAPSSLRQEWRSFTGIKGGGHYATASRLLRKLAPRTWPAYLGATYGLWWARATGRALRSALPAGAAGSGSQR